MKSNYDKYPVVPIGSSQADCAVGWPQILDRIESLKPRVVCIECYPGAFAEQIEREIASALKPSRIFRASDSLKPAQAIDALLAPYLTDDPVFGRMNGIEIADLLDADKLASARRDIESHEGTALVIGTGAALLAPAAALLIYADMARWEIQARQRRNEIANLGADNSQEKPSLKYKRAYFVDWRAADRLKKQLFPRVDFLLDTNDRDCPKMISGKTFRSALRAVVERPFRVVPFFDPGPWGGEWMRETCDLPRDAPNFAWCFDCVPEENSLLLGFGSARVEVPSIDVVFAHPRELLGDAVHGRFGTEFPIRFDMLDTMGGGNLSLQVHPLTEYIQEKFGMNYTQDESYYLLDAGEGAVVYVGLKEGIDRGAMLGDLERAQQAGNSFPDTRYVNQWPAKNTTTS